MKSMMKILAVICLFASTGANAAFNLTDVPSSVSIEGEGFTNFLSHAEGKWSSKTSSVVFAPDANAGVRILVSSPGAALTGVRVEWKASFAHEALMLSDDWCGLGWKRIGKARSSAWYFMIAGRYGADGYGVKVRPNSLVHWTVSPSSVVLYLDVSAGGAGVHLSGRTLEACTLVSRLGRKGESAFASGQAFCRQMCTDPRLPKEPVFGYNDWYCAYGANTATNFLADAAYVVSVTRGLSVKPFVVMDDGWQPMSPPAVQKKTGKFDSGWGPWFAASSQFGMEMGEFASKIAALGAKPGLWYRPMRAWDDAPKAWKVEGHPESFDPTVPEVMAEIASDMKRFREWGFKLVKIDFLVYDFNGQFLFPGKIGESVFSQKRLWRDRSRTSAERMLELYKTLREGAGDDMIIIGCGAFGHLAAGLFEVNRIGFDTSGKNWRQTAENGPHSLAMRSIQHGTFYCIDADCVGLASAGAIAWEKNSQWLDLLSRSHTACFLSWSRALATPEIRAAFAAAFSASANGGDVAEPLDWFKERSPRNWRFSNGEVANYNW